MAGSPSCLVFKCGYQPVQTRTRTRTRTRTSPAAPAAPAVALRFSLSFRIRFKWPPPCARRRPRYPPLLAASPSSHALLDARAARAGLRHRPGPRRALVRRPRLPSRCRRPPRPRRTGEEKATREQTRLPACGEGSGMARWATSTKARKDRWRRSARPSRDPAAWHRRRRRSATGTGRR